MYCIHCSEQKPELTDEQARILLRVDNITHNVAYVAETANASLEEVADTLLKIEKIGQDVLYGGKAKFTGETRIYGNGTVGYKVRCSKCQSLFWVTNQPFAQCVDCRDE